MGIEFELKYRATPEKLEKIRRDYPDGTVIRMQTTYYDTADGSLSAKKFTLRKRQENEACVCTLKTPSGGYGRKEFETRQENIEAAIPELCKLSGEALPEENLEEVCGARFTRYAKTIAFAGCTLEIAADEGVLTGGGKETPLYEVEVELKDGSQEGAIAFARLLAEGYALEAEEKSKFKRALDLAKGE